jgi:hypothetical protein
MATEGWRPLSIPWSVSIRRFAGVYFGRDAETQTIPEDLRKMRANGEPRLLMIVGGSGSGKSSLLKAGILPRLKHKTVDTEWVILPTLRYGQQANEQRTIFDQLTVNLANRGAHIPRPNDPPPPIAASGFHLSHRKCIVSADQRPTDRPGDFWDKDEPMRITSAWINNKSVIL